ncbi:hypothetical protein HMPREF2901_07700 [Enterococcus sp. HMSC073E09]|nr:hypothetical protein A6B47_10265 [Enterococcus faecalis]EPI34452.1 hypothetical protein D348_02644 [Enterococcus faecalis SLO2C-1]OFR24752.1 hypothetical protein HMPREF2901_07700 [Enterococcus sp. HMSC073E09]
MPPTIKKLHKKPPNITGKLFVQIIRITVIEKRRAPNRLGAKKHHSPQLVSRAMKNQLFLS